MILKNEELGGRLVELEAEYSSSFIEALRVCASGRWGLFGHNEHLLPKRPLPDVVQNLMDRGAVIDALRKRLNLEPFALHERFLATRGPAAPNAVGEPKQAQAWLKDFDVS